MIINNIYCNTVIWNHMIMALPTHQCSFYDLHVFYNGFVSLLLMGSNNLCNIFNENIFCYIINRESCKMGLLIIFIDSGQCWSMERENESSNKWISSNLLFCTYIVSKYVWKSLLHVFFPFLVIFRVLFVCFQISAGRNFDVGNVDPYFIFNLVWT